MHDYSSLTSSRITDYNTDFVHELSFLPPEAAWNPKEAKGIEEGAVLGEVDASYNPVQAHHNWPRWPTLRHRPRFDISRYLRIHDPTDPSSHFQGWRRAVIVAAAVTGLVLIINTVFMIVVLVKFPIENGSGILSISDCDVVKRWNTGLHLTINVLGTLVLAASSFTMQCLCSPTRSEVDTAHGKRKSLEIGLVSFRNLFHVKAWKAMLWILLCITTMPLHLLWNSTIFSTSSTNLFSYIVVEQGFLDGDSYQPPDQSTSRYCESMTSVVGLDGVVKTIYDGYKNNSYVRRSPADCLDDYTGNLLDSRRNLIVVVEQPSPILNMSDCGFYNQRWNGSSVIGMNTNVSPGTSWLQRSWPRSKGLGILQQQVKASGTWSFGDMAVVSCLSEVTRATRCQLQFVSYTLYVVVACNLVKFVCMCITARYLWDLDEPVLATVGDAVSSFIDHPDRTTTGLCLLDREKLGKGVWARSGLYYQTYNPVYTRKNTTRLYSATSHARWWWTMIPLISYVILGFALWKVSLVDISSYTYDESMKLKFGSVDTGLVLGLEGESGSGLITNIVVANSFQVVLSATYFLYNSLYTAQCAALEWASFVGRSKKFLRVTWPRGEQRSTYYLQLPWKYGIPLTILLLLMHFLISQSIFLAQLQYRDWAGNLTGDGFADVGFSPRAALTTCLVGVFMVLAQIVNSLRPLDNRIPIHGNRSVVISALCHPESDEQDGPGIQYYHALPQRDVDTVSTKALSWGVTAAPFDIGAGNAIDPSSAKMAGHCGFSAREVELPQSGQVYR